MLIQPREVVGERGIVRPGLYWSEKVLKKTEMCLDCILVVFLELQFPSDFLIITEQFDQMFQ